MFDKVGESTETALSVLVEKMDLDGVCSKEMSQSDRAGACCQNIKEKYNKVGSWEWDRTRHYLMFLCVVRSSYYFVAT